MKLTLWYANLIKYNYIILIPIIFNKNSNDFYGSLIHYSFHMAKKYINLFKYHKCNILLFPYIHKHLKFTHMNGKLNP